MLKTPFERRLMGGFPCKYWKTCSDKCGASQWRRRKPLPEVLEEGIYVQQLRIRVG